MSAELVKHQPAAAPVLSRGGALSLSHMSPYEAWQFCESLANTPLLPDAYRKQPASVLWAMEYGRALGLDVVTTINTIHVIKGKPTQSADLMLSRAREAGHKVRIRQEPGSCTVSIWRSDDPEFENAVTWTFDDAVTAGLCEMRNNRPYSRSQKNEPQNWEKYPRAMLRARAISECVRTACPEVLHGATYTPEEVGAWVDQDGNPVEPPMAPVQQLRPVQQAESYAVAEGDLSGGRDFISEATEAPDAETVRRLYREAVAEKRPKDQLDRIAAIGKEKAAAEQQPTPAEEPGEVIEGEIVETGPNDLPDAVEVAGMMDASLADANAQTAEKQLRAAAAKAGLTNLDEEFERSYGIPISQAGAQQLREMTGILTGHAA